MLLSFRNAHKYRGLRGSDYGDGMHMDTDLSDTEGTPPPPYSVAVKTGSITLESVPLTYSSAPLVDDIDTDITSVETPSSSTTDQHLYENPE